MVGFAKRCVCQWDVMLCNIRIRCYLSTIILNDQLLSRWTNDPSPYKSCHSFNGGGNFAFTPDRNPGSNYIPRITYPGSLYPGSLTPDHIPRITYPGSTLWLIEFSDRFTSISKGRDLATPKIFRWLFDLLGNIIREIIDTNGRQSYEKDLCVEKRCSLNIFLCVRCNNTHSRMCLGNFLVCGATPHTLKCMQGTSLFFLSILGSCTWQEFSINLPSVLWTFSSKH